MFVRFGFSLLYVLFSVPAFAEECLPTAEFDRLDRESVVVAKQFSNPNGETMSLVMTIWKDFPDRKLRGRNFPAQSWSGSLENQAVEVARIFEDIRKTTELHFRMTADNRDAARWTRDTTLGAKRHCAILVNDIGSGSCHRFVTFTCNKGDPVSFPVIEYWDRRNAFFDRFDLERTAVAPQSNRY